MVDKRKPPEPQGGGPRRKRVAPTIDLEATEVPDPPADNPEAAAPASQPEMQAEPAQAAETPLSEPTPAAAAPSEPPREEPAQPEPERAVPPLPPPPPRHGGLGPAIAGGIIGAIVVAALGAGLWYGGYIPAPSTQQSDLPAHIDALEKQVQALRNERPPKLDTAAVHASIGALSQRVNKIENEFGNLPTTDKAAAQRLAALDDTVKSLGTRADDITATANKAQQGAAAAQKAVDDLKQSVQNVANTQKSAPPVVAPAALYALQKKVAALESEFASARGQLNNDINNVRGEVTSAQKKIATASAGDRAARLALSAAALRTAVISGAPYAAQLAQAKSLGADAKTLAPLERFAQQGLSTRKELAGELSKLIPALREAAGAQETTGSFLERLQANASKLVRITPVGAPAGDDRSDVLARIAAEAARADIDSALADLGKLPDKVRDPAQEWIAKAKARQDALAALRQFSAQSARALGKG